MDAVVIATRPEITEDTMRECADLGVKDVWMHRGPDAGSGSYTGYYVAKVRAAVRPAAAEGAP